jgi:predicted lipid carrier protein YhbT
MPEAVYSRPMAAPLNRILAAQIRDRELGFLRARTIRIQVLDAGLSFALTLSHGGFAASPRHHDLLIRGMVYDFLMLMSRREDSDTLFFLRRLEREGDTALALEVRNLLDGLDRETFPLYRPADFVIPRGVRLYECLFGGRG